MAKLLFCYAAKLVNYWRKYVGL